MFSAQGEGCRRVNNHLGNDPRESHMSHTELATSEAPNRKGVRRLAERGLTTVEYAIGLVAAATAALVLLRIFNDNAFFQTLMQWVLNIFKNLVNT